MHGIQETEQSSGKIPEQFNTGTKEEKIQNQQVGRTFALGDIHGNYKALKQCLERSNFDYDNDTLIFLGDVCDGWTDVYKCI